MTPSFAKTDRQCVYLCRSLLWPAYLNLAIVEDDIPLFYLRICLLGMEIYLSKKKNHQLKIKITYETKKLFFLLKKEHRFRTNQANDFYVHVAKQIDQICCCLILDRQNISSIHMLRGSTNIYLQSLLFFYQK